MAILAPADLGALVQAKAMVDVAASAAAPLLYVGPDQLLPFASFLGAILGLLLMFWNWFMKIVRKCLSLFGRRGPEPEGKTAD